MVAKPMEEAQKAFSCYEIASAILFLLPTAKERDKHVASKAATQLARARPESQRNSGPETGECVASDSGPAANNLRSDWCT